MLDAKQIKGIFARDPANRPYNRRIQSSTAIGLKDCSVGDNNLTTDGYFLGNMGGGAFFNLLVPDIPETKIYDVMIRYAYGDSGIQNNSFTITNLTTTDSKVINIVSSNNWNAYVTVSTTLNFNQGHNIVRIVRTGLQGWNTDYINISESSYGKYLNLGDSWFIERLNITTQNSLPTLSKTPFPEKLLLWVNGVAQDALSQPPDFSYSGKTITWNPASAGFPILPDYDVLVMYQTQD